mmetsp:Transcript_60437/g.187134  ORF Transcript_60437/g.187134 Transcript_60437/m.187134 type:complete len:137 (-) Transcript_60437:215-625(-)
MVPRGLAIVFLLRLDLVLGAEAQCNLGTQECGGSGSDDSGLLQLHQLNGNVGNATAEEKCIRRRSLGECENCLSSDQCLPGKSCSPFMKKCVSWYRSPCSHPWAECPRTCTDIMRNSECRCRNRDFPYRWQRETCR